MDVRSPHSRYGLVIKNPTLESAGFLRFGQGILISRPFPGPDIVRGRDKKAKGFLYGREIKIP
jgi:hypothetical protein